MTEANAAPWYVRIPVNPKRSEFISCGCTAARLNTSLNCIDTTGPVEGRILCKNDSPSFKSSTLLYTILIMNIQPEIKRQLLHISVVVFALLLRFLSAPWAFMVAMLAFVHNVLILPKYAPRVFREREHLLQGISVYPLVVALLILIFSDQLILAGGAWAILSFGDGFSTIIGKWNPVANIPWNPDKSLGGFLGFLVFGTIGAFLIMAFIGPFPTWGHLLLAAFGASLLAALFETLPLPWDDNIVVSLAAAAALTALWGIDLSPALPNIGWMTLLTAFGSNLIIASIAWCFGLVSKTGALGGGIIGMVIWGVGGLFWYLLLILFFIIATAATRLGYHEKDYMGVAQESEGKRDAKHALANCLASILAVIGFGFTEGMDILFQIFFTAAFATALADTVATELGQLYGKTPFLPTTFRAVKPGTVGAISMEGTLFGMGASLIYAIVAFAFTVIPLNGIPAVALGAWGGSFLESYIGSRWTEEGVEISNEWMNLLNTTLGGSLAIIILTITGGAGG